MTQSPINLVTLHAFLSSPHSHVNTIAQKISNSPISPAIHALATRSNPKLRAHFTRRHSTRPPTTTASARDDALRHHISIDPAGDATRRRDGLASRESVRKQGARGDGREAMGRRGKGERSHHLCAVGVRSQSPADRAQRNAISHSHIHPHPLHASLSSPMVRMSSVRLQLRHSRPSCIQPRRPRY